MVTVNFFFVFIEFVTILLLFYVCFFLFFFRPWGMWDPSSPTRGWTHTSYIGRWSLNHWTTREVPSTLFIIAWDHLPKSSAKTTLAFILAILSSMSNMHTTLVFTVQELARIWAVGINALESSTGLSLQRPLVDMVMKTLNRWWMCAVWSSAQTPWLLQTLW